jgi:hypothetical protein
MPSSLCPPLSPYTAAIISRLCRACGVGFQQHACCNTARMCAHGAACAAFAWNLMQLLASTSPLRSPVLMTVVHANELRCNAAMPSMSSANIVNRRGSLEEPSFAHSSSGQAAHLLQRHASRGCSVRSTLVNSRCSLSVSTIELLPCVWLRPNSSRSKREWHRRSSRRTASCSASWRAAGEISRHA